MREDYSSAEEDQKFTRLVALPRNLPIGGLGITNDHDDNGKARDDLPTYRNQRPDHQDFREVKVGPEQSGHRVDDDRPCDYLRPSFETKSVEAPNNSGGDHEKWHRKSSD